MKKFPSPSRPSLSPTPRQSIESCSKRLNCTFLIFSFSGWTLTKYTQKSNRTNRSVFATLSEYVDCSLSPKDNSSELECICLISCYPLCEELTQL